MEWNGAGRDGPDMDPLKCRPLTSHRGAETTPWGQDAVCKKRCGNTRTSGRLKTKV